MSQIRIVDRPKTLARGKYEEAHEALEKAYETKQAIVIPNITVAYDVQNRYSRDRTRIARVRKQADGTAVVWLEDRAS